MAADWIQMMMKALFIADESQIWQLIGYRWWWCCENNDDDDDDGWWW